MKSGALEVPISNMPAFGNGYLVIRINRRLLIAMAVSLLVHVILFIFIRPNVQINIRPVKAMGGVLSVHLNPPAPTHTPYKQPPYQRSHVQTPPHHANQSAILRPSMEIASVLSTKQAVITVPTKPATPTPGSSADAAPTDMSSYISASRARRQMAERVDNPDNPPSADNIRNANINRNLQPQGGGGVFQVMRVGMHTAAFSFRGWDNTYNNGRREEIEVETDSGGDIEHAVIRKMIAIIRKRHKGDFYWESQRLHQEVTLSARMIDNAGLEDFLMREFFKAGLRPSEQ
jgi:hypothetical protein